MVAAITREELMSMFPIALNDSSTKSIACEDNTLEFHKYNHRFSFIHARRKSHALGQISRESHSANNI